MAAKVRIESAGSHVFDLHHLRRQGGEEVVELLLRLANIGDDLTWRLRVEKKVFCTAETRPVAVAGCKPWCCYLKIKPGDNNSGHFCSLLMPQGFRGAEVCEALKRVEHRIGRNWQNGLKEQRTMSTDINLPGHEAAWDNAPAPSQAPPGDQGSTGGQLELSGWSTDEDKVKLTLLAIDEVDRAGPHSSQARFVEILADKLGWQGANRHTIGGVFTSLVRRKLIIGVRRGCKAVGYTLTPSGRQLIWDLLSHEEAAKASPAGPAADPAEFLTTLSGFAQRFQDASKKLQVNRAERQKHEEAIARLDAEAQELSKIVDNPEVRELIQRLIQITGQSLS